MKISQLLVLVLLASGSAWAQSQTTIQKASTAERLVLADRNGLSLYTFKPDQGGDSTCYDGCARAWPPILVSAEEKGALSGALATTTRKDGQLQLTIGGHPVYLFAGDELPGDINGEGLGDVWFLVDVKIAK